MASDLTPEQVELRKCVEELDALELEVAQRLTPMPSETKVIPFKFAESLVFRPGDMKAQKMTYKNGAEDLYLAIPTHSVSRLEDNVGPVTMGDSDAGFVSPGGEVVFFDFFWNYSIGSQGENYGSLANDVLWLSRRSLGNRDRAKRLTFRYPLRLKGGDSITFSVKPAFWRNVAPAAQKPIIVTLAMIGYRDGRMAESAYDPDFRPAYRSAK